MPEFRFRDVNCSSECSRKVSPRMASPSVSPRGGGMHSVSETKQQRSYPLPLPPGATSKSPPVSPTIPAAKSPLASPRTPERAENVRSPWKKGKLIGRGPLGNLYLGFNRCALLFGCLSFFSHVCV